MRFVNSSNWSISRPSRNWNGKWAELAWSSKKQIESGYQEAAASTDSAEKEVQAPIEPAPQRVVSPTVGLFYAAVAIGQKVKSGELVGRCTVDTLQLSQDIYSPVDGEIVNILVTDGQLVDYGKELLVVKQS
jgi:acetyl-CoA carboxylase biotin carboxyl carrier protein